MRYKFSQDVMGSFISVTMSPRYVFVCSERSLISIRKFEVLIFVLIEGVVVGRGYSVWCD